MNHHWNLGTKIDDKFTIHYDEQKEGIKRSIRNIVWKALIDIINQNRLETYVFVKSTRFLSSQTALIVGITSIIEPIAEFFGKHVDRMVQEVYFQKASENQLGERVIVQNSLSRLSSMLPKSKPHISVPQELSASGDLDDKRK